jgi:pimeloyl-ACP methyl ester carboxylesterase
LIRRLVWTLALALGLWGTPSDAQQPTLDPRAGPRVPDPTPPFPYRTENVSYRNAQAGITLAGTLTMPAGTGPFPAVALISGSGPQERDGELFGRRVFLTLADHLTRRGIAVLRSDDRGVGRSQGAFAQATSEDFAGDAAAAASFLRSRPEVRRDAVGLLGLSEGGLVAPMVAVASDSLAFLVLMGTPGVTGEEILYTQSGLISQAMGLPPEQLEYNRRLQQQLFTVIKEEASPEQRHARMTAVLRSQFADVPPAERAASGLTREVEDEWIAAQIVEMGGPWFRYFLLHDPRPVLRRVRQPVLALNGEIDLQVPSAVNLTAVESALREGGNTDVTAVEIPRLNHLFQTAVSGIPAEYGQLRETMSPVAMDRIAEWILEKTRR